MTPANREPEFLKEDADERRMFDQELASLYKGMNVLHKVADCLCIWHKMAPNVGSYGKVLAILSNECRKAAIEVGPRILPPDAQPKPEASDLEWARSLRFPKPVAGTRATTFVQLSDDEAEVVAIALAAARQAGAQAGWDAAIDALRIRAAQWDAADWLAANRPARTHN